MGSRERPAMETKEIAVTLRPEGRRVPAREGDSLAGALIEAGVPLDLACGGKGLCGRCAIRIVGGEPPPPDETEAERLRRTASPADHRLACRIRVRDGLTLEIPESSLIRRAAILETGLETRVPVEPAVRSFRCRVERPPLEAPDAWLEALEAALKRKRLGIETRLLRRLPQALTAAGGEATATLYEDRELLDLVPGDAADSVLGAAADIGTSTVVVELLDLVSGRRLGRAAALNAQAAFGADIVSRLTYAYQNPDHLRRLHRALVDLLNDLLAELADTAGRRREEVMEVVAAGNTAMSHFLLGVPVDGLAVAPFHGVFGALPALAAADAGLALHPSARLYLAPNIRSFVGGDIAAGLGAAELEQAGENVLFLDLGTNGEIVLKTGSRFLTTSTAAGPAFEGMSISCGMLAVAGAVDRVEWRDGFRLRTIGGGPARGLCGTGLIDAAAVALSRGLLTPGGRISAPGRSIELAPGLALTQADVRELQLAIAAVRSGVRMMLRAAGLKLDRLDRVLIAGAFGNDLDIASARALGVLPDLPGDRIAFLGNTALAGARKLLLNAPARRACERLAARIRHLPLAGRPEFQDLFVRSLELGPYAGE